MVNSVCLTRNTLLSFEKVSPAQENTFTISILTIYVSLLDSQSRGHHNKIPLGFQLELVITYIELTEEAVGTKLQLLIIGALWGQNCLSSTGRGTKLSLADNLWPLPRPTAHSVLSSPLSHSIVHLLPFTAESLDTMYFPMLSFAHLLPLSADKPPQMLNILWQKSSPFPQRAHVLLYLVSLITFCHTLY